MAKNTGIKAIVQSIVEKARHGPYATAKARDVKGSITFSLQSPVWAGKQWPEPGTSVFLDQLEQRRAGWRAKFGRLWKPSDEQEDSHSKQPTKSARSK